MCQVCCVSGDTYTHLWATRSQFYQEWCASADCEWSYISSESGRPRPGWTHQTLAHLKGIKYMQELKAFDAPVSEMCHIPNGLWDVYNEKSRKLHIDRFSDGKSSYAWKNPDTPYPYQLWFCCVPSRKALMYRNFLVLQRRQKTLLCFTWILRYNFISNYSPWILISYLTTYDLWKCII